MVSETRELVMAKKWTHKACFEHFGTVPKNLRWSWSGRSLDGQVVSVTFWADRFEEKGRIYRGRRRASGVSQAGFTELLENLKWARDNCDGTLRIIIAIPKDPKANPRSIAECFPHKTLRMRLTSLDEAAGEYVAERIDEAA
jgi:hypothetical protein